MAHVVSILILIHSVITKKSANGISLKTQILYALVFITRYFNLLKFEFGSLYNFSLKIIFLSTSFYSIFIIKKFTKQITQYVDDFKISYLIIPCAIISLIFNYKFSFFEIIWSFSLWLESVAILPQLFMLQSQGQSDLLTIHYIFALGLYRAFYIPNWIYRYITEERFDIISVSAGLIQTLVYSDFFYVYYNKVIKNSVSLPQ
ncbi:endoplasmic reticulum retention protein [Pichia californica]|uniref:ER lumen protein-retaining receptor n=1 Tax=Pichia californica TaxID=460514 RepID=A0A9P6WI28_9ASCO|nr:endoplasmic reticulum retention protein [[Candida] californica]KAG0687296.1 endoplasmic reticulum retention protein [[Candida] californica]